MLTAIALSPCIARAFDIGEVELQSRLGEPLHALVELKPGKGEQIDSTCLSLIEPSTQERNARDYLIRARLAIKVVDGRQYVDISTQEAFHDPFVNLRLKIKCTGMGVIINTLTILPEHKVKTLPAAAAPSAPQQEKDAAKPSLANAPAAAAPPVIPVTLPENTATQKVASIPQTAVVALPEAEPQSSIEPSPKGAPPQSKPRKTAREKIVKPVKKPQVLQTALKKPEGAAPFVLKLSTELIDESRIEKLSAEERESLRKQQIMLDDDGQSAQLLDQQQRFVQALEELERVKLHLAQLSANHANVVLSSIAAPTIAESAPLPILESHLEPVVSEPDMTSSPSASQFDLPEIAYLIAGLLVAGMSLALGLRIYNRRKSRQKAGNATQQINKVRAGPPVTVAPVNTPKPVTPVSNPKPAVPANKPRLVVPANVPLPVAPSVPAPKYSLSEDDLIMEEAELYAIHGHPDKAVNILKEMIERNPAKPEARRLLLSIYSSVGKAAEFEQAARDFQRLDPGSTSWRGIQALGRTLDINNPLYADATPMQTQAMRRPLGEILVKMGALSLQDMKHCLAEFDPKKHGRFGGYLITRKIITLAQLDRALLKQQNVSSETSMPTLEEKPLDLEFDILSDKAQVMDLDFGPLSEQPKSFDINIESLADAPQSQDIAPQPAAPPRP